MKSVFLAYRFDQVNKDLARQVEELLESHGLRAASGDALSGEVITPAVLQRIADADAIVALLTRRDQIMGAAPPRWTTHDYCKGELQHARTLGKPAIALLENGVDVGGLFNEHEHIAYDADAPLDGFLKLSRTIWSWKMKIGRTVKIQVLPPEVAQEIWAHKDQCEWEYRLSREGTDTNWFKANAKKEPGGLFLYVRVPDDTMQIEVRIKGDHKIWSSDSTPFFTPLTMS
jgi:hypothetical protein